MDACCARKPTRAWISYTSAKKKKHRTAIIRTVRGKTGGVERELTMKGVRRISCRPRPPRMTVLPVSMMTTLESRKPMLHIAHEREPRDGQTRTGLGFPWRVHTHTQASTNNALAPRDGSIFDCSTHSLRRNGSHSFLMVTLAGHTLPRGNFISFGIAIFLWRVSSACMRRGIPGLIIAWLSALPFALHVLLMAWRIRPLDHLING